MVVLKPLEHPRTSRSDIRYLWQAPVVECSLPRVQHPGRQIKFSKVLEELLADFDATLQTEPFILEKVMTEAKEGAIPVAVFHTRTVLSFVKPIICFQCQ